MIYLDYAGSGLVCPEIAERYVDYCSRYSINPHGGTRQAEACRRAILDAERRLLAALSIPEREASVIWTSGGTEALNLALLGTDYHGGLQIDALSHHAMLEAARWRAAHEKREVALCLPWDMERRDGLCGVCHVNNETGYVVDLQQIRKTIGESALQLVDASQSAGKMVLPWAAAHIDLLVVSSRKIGGPASGGALIVRKGVTVKPLLYGGGQQGGVRPGTLDAVGIVMFADAMEMAVKDWKTAADTMAALSRRLREQLSQLTPSCVFISDGRCCDSIVMVAFPGYEGAVLKRILANDYDIVIGTGSACSAESGETSHVLKAMGYDERTARGALRISMSPQTTAADVDTFVEALAAVIRRY